MRRDCTELTQAVVPSGHRMAQKQPIQVNAALAEWLAAKAPDAWLGRRQATGALASGANTASTRTAYGDRSRKWRDATVKECTSNEVTMTSVINSLIKHFSRGGLQKLERALRFCISLIVRGV